MAEENKSIEFAEGESQNFAHLLGSGTAQEADDKPQIDYVQNLRQQSQSLKHPGLTKQYSNLYEGESNAFDDIFERVEDNDASAELQKVLDSADPLIDRLTESRPSALNNSTKLDQESEQNDSTPATQVDASLRLGTGEMSFAAADDEIDTSDLATPSTTKADSVASEIASQSITVEIESEGEGELIPSGATVTLHYNGKLQDGTLFDSSYMRGKPFEFKVGTGEVIKGWDQAMLQLKKRSKAEITIPPSLAYGETGHGDKVPPNSTLIFSVEIFGFRVERPAEGDEGAKAGHSSSNPDVTRGTVGYYAREQFKFHSTLGRGAYGQVYLASRNSLKFALKQLEKAHITKYDKVQAVFRERDISSELSQHSNVVKFHGSFQDEDNLYFLLEYCPYGSLAELLKHFRTLPVDLVRFYAAQVVCVLEFMHSRHIVHRDLKPGNILIDDRYCLKVTDFGDSKKLDPDEDPYQRLDNPEPDFNDDRNSLFEEPAGLADDRAARQSNAFVGTALYISPEMLDENISCPGMDLWALGCMIYEMRVGQTPFHGQVDYEVFSKIQKRQLVVPNDLEPDAVDIIDKLLQLDPRDRLGSGQDGSDFDFASLKAHPFFGGINFDTLDQTSPPIPAERYTRYFEELRTRAERQSSEGMLFQQSNIVAPQSPPQNQGVLEESKEQQLQRTSPAPAAPNGATGQAKLNRQSTRKFGGGNPVKVEYQGVVLKYPKRKKLVSRPRCRNLILTNQPRLYFTTTENADGKEDIYLSDIILFSDLKLTVNKSGDMFSIHCPTSQLTYNLKTNDAAAWVRRINEAILEKNFEDS